MAVGKNKRPFPSSGLKMKEFNRKIIINFILEILMAEFRELLALRSDIQTGAAQAESLCLNGTCAHRMSLQHPWKGSICCLCTTALECSQLAGRTRDCALGQELGCHSQRLEPESAFKVFDFANVDANSTVFVSKSLRCHGTASIFQL